MNIRDIQALHGHNCWATERVLNALGRISADAFTAKRPESYYGSLRGTLVHALDAEGEYRSRMEEGKGLPDLMEDLFPTAEPLAARWKAEQDAMRAYIATLTEADIEAVAVYQASGGERRRPRWHIFSQLFNHGTAHRAEAAVILTMLGQSPGDLDFVVWVDETGGE